MKFALAPVLLNGLGIMSKCNVVSLKAIRDLKNAQASDLAYEKRLLKMEKVDLLDEMIRFQERRSQIGSLTEEMMIQGQILFKVLEESAESEEFLILTRSYRKHLQYELQAYQDSKTSK
jgi:hypothetical protein